MTYAYLYTHVYTCINIYTIVYTGVYTGVHTKLPHTHVVISLSVPRKQNKTNEKKKKYANWY